MFHGNARRAREQGCMHCLQRVLISNYCLLFHGATFSLRKFSIFFSFAFFGASTTPCELEGASLLCTIHGRECVRARQHILRSTTNGPL